MKTLILAFTLLALISCEDKVTKPHTVVIQKVDIKEMPLESDTNTFNN